MDIDTNYTLNTTYSFDDNSVKTNDNECIICLENIDIEKNYLMFFKSHCGCEVTVHYNCGNEWLKLNSKCPICAENIDQSNIFTNNMNYICNINEIFSKDIDQQNTTDQETEITVNSSNNLLIDNFNNNNNNNYYDYKRQLFILIILLFFTFMIIIMIISFSRSN